MNRFICKIRTPQGQITKIEMYENDKITCIKKLKRNGMTPISVDKKFSILPFINFDKDTKKQKKVTSKIHTRKRRKIKFKKDIDVNISNKVSITELRRFTQDLYLLKRSNFTSSKALITIINNTKNTYFKGVINRLLKDVETGKFMYKTMSEYTNIFSPVYINFIKTGELTGNLEEYLKHATNYLEHEEQIKEKIRTDLMPSIVAFFGMIIAIILSTLFGIPVIEKIVQTNNRMVELPGITVAIMKIIDYIFDFWFVIVILILILVIAIIRYINTDKGKYKFDHFKYTNIIFGKITYLIEFSRVIKSVFLNLQSKMRIQDALEISKNTITNTYMISKVEDAINNLYVGKSWIPPFEETKILNSIVIEMMKKAEKGDLWRTLGKTIEYLDEEIETQIDVLLKRLADISHVMIAITLLLFLVVFLIPSIQLFLGGFLFI